MKGYLGWMVGATVSMSIGLFGCPPVDSPDASDVSDADAEDGDVEEEEESGSSRSQYEPHIRQFGGSGARVTGDAASLANGSTVIGGFFDDEMRSEQTSGEHTGFVLQMDASGSVVTEAYPDYDGGNLEVRSVSLAPIRADGEESKRPNVLVAGTIRDINEGSKDVFLASYEPHETGDWRADWPEWPVDWKVRVGEWANDARIDEIQPAAYAAQPAESVPVFGIGRAETEGGFSAPVVWRFEVSGSGVNVDGRGVFAGPNVLGPDFELVQVLPDGNGGAIVGGVNEDPAGGRSSFVIGLDQKGEIRWERRIATDSNTPKIVDLRQLEAVRSDNGDVETIVAAGTTTGGIGEQPHAGGKDLFAATFGADGARGGVAMTGTSGEDQLRDVVSLTPEEFGIRRILLLGESRTGGDSSGVFSVRMEIGSAARVANGHADPGGGAPPSVALGDLDGDNFVDNGSTPNGSANLGDLNGDNHLEAVSKRRAFDLAIGSEALGDLDGDNFLGDLDGDNFVDDLVHLGDLDGDNFIEADGQIVTAGTTPPTSEGGRDTTYATSMSDVTEFERWCAGDSSSSWTTSTDGRTLSRSSSDGLASCGGPVQGENHTVSMTLETPSSSNATSGERAAGLVFESPTSSGEIGSQQQLVLSWTTTSDSSQETGFVLARLDGSASPDGLTTSDLEGLAGSGDASILDRRTGAGHSWGPESSYTISVTYRTWSDKPNGIVVELPPRVVPGGANMLTASGVADVAPSDAAELALFTDRSAGVSFSNLAVRSPGMLRLTTPDMEESPSSCPSSEGACGEACNGSDDDGDGTVDEGCSCTYQGSSAGVCGDAVIDASGTCSAQWYESTETSCADGRDNDCDGRVDEACPMGTTCCRGLCRTQSACSGAGGDTGTSDTDTGISDGGYSDAGGFSDADVYSDGGGGSDAGSGWAGAVEVAVGNGHSCARDANGRVKCWGENADGQLGDGTTTSSPAPVDVSGLTGASDLAAGGDITYAMLGNGDVMYWGDEGNLSSTTPTQRIGKAFGNATGVFAGGLHGCSIGQNGSVRCWGRNRHGQLGDGTTTDDWSGVTVQNLSSPATMGVGGRHTCAVTSSGSVECWGDNRSGQLGDGTTTKRSSPTGMQGIASATQVDAAGAFSCVVLGNGGVKCVGSNSDGQLGDGTTNSSKTPVAVQNVSQASAITLGNDYACAIVGSGSVKCWGKNFSGELGDGTTKQRSTAVSVKNISSAVSISAGSNHTCAALSSGDVNCWGANYTGKLGNGTTGSGSTTPVKVQF